LALVAGCSIRDEDWKNAPEGTLFIVGCAFKHRQGYIFMTGETYTLIETINALKDLFVPIESPAEALTYAQLRTGLHAYFDLSYDPTLLYLQETIDGTHVTEEAGGYVMNLYHLEVCGCEPWITSQVMIRVDRSGEITWEDAIPVYMTTGFDCAD